MSKIGYTVLGAVAAYIAGNFVQRSAELYQADNLRKFDIKPGAWFCYYMGDALTHFGEDKPVESAIVHIGSGEYIWATATPEWDREWFAKRGYLFPEKWVPYTALAQYKTEFKEIGT